ncbi:hypothetical protein [Maricaulis sp.]|uniref:hypothetical protein n=1 Tax=Maricaulis sp. TaxID=1486257 RepID=UPI003A925242
MPPYRVPSGQRIAALRDGTAIPDEFERHYLAALERGATLENAAKAARAALEPAASQASPAETIAPPPVLAAPVKAPEPPEPPKIEDLDPPLDLSRPWYKADPRHISSVRRALQPAIWATTIVIGLQMLASVAGFWTEEPGPGYWTVLIVMTIVSAITGLLMMGAYQGSAIAAWVLLALHAQPIASAIGDLFNSTDLLMSIGLGVGIVLAVSLAGLWSVAATTLSAYRKSLKAAAAALPGAN